MCNICAIYVQYMCNICAIMCNICPIFVQYLCKICAIYVQYMCSICAIYVQYMCNLCAKYVQYMCNICEMYVQNISTDTVFCPIRTHQYGSIHPFGFCSWRGLNRVDYESDNILYMYGYSNIILRSYTI